MSNDLVRIKVKKVKKVDVEVISPGTPQVVLTKGEATELRAKLIEIRSKIEKSYYEIGGRLNEVLTGKVLIGDDKVTVYKAWGYESFAEYCEEELLFGERKGFFVVGVWRVIQSGLLTRDEVDTVGWTKARLLAPLATKGLLVPENKKKWMDAATTMPYNSFREMAKVAVEKQEEKAEKEEKKEIETADPSKVESKEKHEEKKDVPEVPEKIYVFHEVGFHEEQWKIWQLALKKLRQNTGSDKECHLLEMMARDYLSEGFGTKGETLARIVGRIERIFDVRMFVVDNKKDKVVYGQKLWEALKQDLEEKEKDAEHVDKKGK